MLVDSENLDFSSLGFGFCCLMHLYIYIYICVGVNDWDVMRLD